MFCKRFDNDKLMNKKTVCVIGLGYIGLPTAALIANKGYLVSGIDIDEDIVSKINKGEVHIIEDGLKNRPILPNYKNLS